MHILAFDTSLGACSAALIWRETDGTDLPGWTTCSAVRYEEMETGHAERLMPMIGEVLAEAGRALNQLDAIGVTVGPGTFTGIRTGIAAARGLALARRIPVFGTTSLTLMGASAVVTLRAHTLDSPVAVCVDARKDHLYVQQFGPDFDDPAGDVLLLTAEEAVRALPNVRIAVGSAAAAFQDAARTVGREVGAALPRLQPHAAHMAELRLDKLDPPRPLYLRAPDARPQTGKSVPRSNA